MYTFIYFSFFLYTYFLFILIKQVIQNISFLIVNTLCQKVAELRNLSNFLELKKFEENSKIIKEHKRKLKENLQLFQGYRYFYYSILKHM